MEIDQLMPIVKVAPLHSFGDVVVYIVLMHCCCYCIVVLQQTAVGIVALL